jgi:hypothetical protein
MADTYGVTPEDVGDELISLFPDGFAVSTKPTVDQVAGFITDADAVVTLHVSRAMGETELLTAATVRLARRYIIDAVKAQVMRIVWQMNDPRDIDAAAKPYETLAMAMLDRIDGEPVKTVPVAALPWSSAPSETTRNTLEW